MPFIVRKTTRSSGVALPTLSAARTNNSLTVRAVPVLLLLGATRAFLTLILSASLQFSLFLACTFFISAPHIQAIERTHRLRSTLQASCHLDVRVELANIPRPRLIR